MRVTFHDCWHSHELARVSAWSAASDEGCFRRNQLSTVDPRRTAQANRGCHTRIEQVLEVAPGFKEFKAFAKRVSTGRCLLSRFENERTVPNHDQSRSLMSLRWPLFFFFAAPGGGERLGTQEDTQPPAPQSLAVFYPDQETPMTKC